MKASPCDVLLTTLIVTMLTPFCSSHSIQSSPLPPADIHAEQELKTLNVPPHPTSPNNPPVQDTQKAAVHNPRDLFNEFEDVLQDDEKVIAAEKSPPKTSSGLQNVEEADDDRSPSQNGADDSNELATDDSNTQNHFPNRDREEEELQTLQEGSKTDSDGDEDDDDEEETGKIREPSFADLDTREEENEDAARELESMKFASEDDSHPDDEYDGYDTSNSDGTENPDHDTLGEFSNSQTILTDHSPDNPDSLVKLHDTEALRSYLDNVMEGHDDVKRGDDVIEVPGFSPVRVIELNETIYINDTEDDNLPKFQPVPIPDKFEDYDVNRDGVISLPEVRYVTRATEGARQAFRAADIDGDGWMDREEFQKAGWGLPVDYPPPPSPSQEKMLETSAHSTAHQQQSGEFAARQKERS